MRRPTSIIKAHPGVGTELETRDHRFEPNKVLDVVPQDPSLPGLKVCPDESPENICGPTR
jgi:hypothetical protein